MEITVVTNENIILTFQSMFDLRIIIHVLHKFGNHSFVEIGTLFENPFVLDDEFIYSSNIFDSFLE